MAGLSLSDFPSGFGGKSATPPGYIDPLHPVYPATQQQLPQQQYGSPGNPTSIPSLTPQYGINPLNAGERLSQTPQNSTNLYSTGPGGTVVNGRGSVTQPAYEEQQQTQLEGTLKQSNMQEAARLQAEAESRRLGYLSTVTRQQSPEVGPQGGPAFDENAARSAAFARAKEEAGRTGIASLKALQDVMASRGLTGSSVEGNGIADVVGGAAGRVNDYTRTALTTDLNRAANIADRNQQNAITQRGQNLSLMPSLMGLITAGNGVY
jgi:hypothetical protein